MEVIPWLKVYVVTLILVFTIMIVIVRQKKLQFVIVNVTKRKIFKKQLVKLLNVNRKFNMTSQKVRSYQNSKSNRLRKKVIKMKKIALILICCLVLIGCKNKDNNDNKFYRQYKEYENKIDNHNEFLNATNEFNIRLVVNKVEDKKYRYDVIIDTPTINMYHLQAIAKVAGDDNESLPTLGILEEDIFSLVPEVVDKANGIYKGVNLSGITSKSEFSVLVYLTFSTDKQSNNKEERYIKLYGNAT